MLAFNAPSVSRERPVVSDDSMAGDGDCSWIVTAGLRHGACGLWLANSTGDLRIARHKAAVLAWEGIFPSREALEEHIGQRLAPYLLDSFRSTPNGWRLAFEPREILESQLQLNGDHWADWLATKCPALLVRGRESRITTQEHLEQMAARRPNTRLVTLDGGHVVHQDNPSGFADIVREFLHDL